MTALHKYGKGARASLWSPLSGSMRSPAFAGISPVADLRHLLLAIEAFLSLILLWPFRILFAGSKNKSQVKPKSAAFQFPMASQFRNAKREMLLKALKKTRLHPPMQVQPVVTTLPSKPSGLLVFAQRVRDRVSSLEFWLGITSGLVTRMATRAAIQAAFTPTHGTASVVAGFAACAVAGLAAGMVVHLVRTFYRNAHVPRDGKKEKYLNGALWQCAVTGLLGGFIGGFAGNAGGLLAPTGSVGAGVITGITAGVAQASVRAWRAARDGSGAGDWSQWALQGAVLGATGGLLGVVASDLLSAEASAATIVVETGVPQPLNLQVMDPCGSNPCEVPFGSGATQFALQPVTVIHDVVVSDMHGGMPHLQSPPMLRAPHFLSHASHSALDNCLPRHHYHHHHRQVAHHHHHHLHHIAHRQTVEPLEVIIVEPGLIAVPLPPHIIAEIPIVGPPPVQQQVYSDPCQTGDCGPCTDDQGYSGQGYNGQVYNGSVNNAQPYAAYNPANYSRTGYGQAVYGSTDPNGADIKGPCAAPGAACVERVSFNSDGDATRVVLEPGAQSAGAHFENAAGAATNADYRQGTVVAANEDSDESPVSLVVPFAGYAPGMMMGGEPMPA
jgi:hypothetical protein